MKNLLALACIVFSSAAHSAPAGEVICSYAPSQSKVVSSTLGAAGGAAGTVTALAAATGMTVVTHSSGALLLTGSGGYIAGTLGGAALAGPAIVVVGLVAGTVAGTVELICAPKNHPEEVARIHAMAEEFKRRSKIVAGKGAGAFERTGIRTRSILFEGTARIKEIGGDVYRYAYRKG